MITGWSSLEVEPAVEHTARKYQERLLLQTRGQISDKVHQNEAVVVFKAGKNKSHVFLNNNNSKKKQKKKPKKTKNNNNKGSVCDL